MPQHVNFIITLSFLVFNVTQFSSFVSQIRPLCLPTDGMMKHFIFASNYRTDLQWKLQHKCVRKAIFVRVILMQNVPEKLIHFFVPVTLIYIILIQS